MTPTAGGQRERLGILGGTFDPVHFGHLAAAVSAYEALHLHRVLMVVAAKPWQKSQRTLAPAEDRLAMVEAAVKGVAGLEASRMEIDRGGDTYTVDTLEALAGEQPERDLYLVVGADVASDLASWHRAEDVAALATLVVVSRPGLDDLDIPPPWRVERVAMPHVDVSSSQVRHRLRDGLDIHHLAPAEVIDLIRSLGLYSGAQMSSRPGDR